MLDWAALQKEHQELITLLANPSLDSRERSKLQKKASQLQELLSFYTRMQKIDEECSLNKELERAESDPELKRLYLDEIVLAQEQRLLLERELDELLYPPDERNDRSVFIEIRAGAGGQEAALFVSDLARMYQLYATEKHWEVSVVEANQTDIGGYKELILYIKGRSVFKFFKFESGVHRVQRVPKTENAGRVHTSTVTVAVMPEASDVEITINPQDLRIDTYRSSGAGGQHVNTTDSAIRITHLPTGLVVTCQDERSQIKNKAKALKVLQARLLEAERSRRDAEESAKRKEQVGSGDRAEKVRTYNFPQNRVTDHRVDVTLKKLDLVMDGDLDDLFGPLLQWDQEERRRKGSLFIT